MIEHTNYPVDPWAIRETALDLAMLAQSESVFALGNGHVGVRGNLDEGDPHGLAGTYLNGVHEIRPLPYAESAYGNPEAGETVLNVTDGKLFRLLVDDELFDVRYGELLEHERVLDFRAGVLRRNVHWRSPSGREVRITSTRMVSLVQRGVMAILYEVTPRDEAARLVVQSELVANDDGQAMAPDLDPRAASSMRAPLRAEEAYEDDLRVSLVHCTGQSHIRICATMDHEIMCPGEPQTVTEADKDVGRMTVAGDVPMDQTLRILKYVAYGWSSHRSLPSVRAQARGSLAEARHTGWDGLLAEQRAYLERFWERGDVQVEGDDELQQAVRFALFHVLQAGARGERRAIPAKGLTGSGYDGHAFWDTESFVLPVLTYTAPVATADALRWRRETLDQARERAAQLGLAGAAFPWRTITGRECSGYWPAGAAAFHVNADIAGAVLRYQQTVDDPAFEQSVGLPLLVETARLWESLGHVDLNGEFRIPGVTGPDEYSAVADDNTYTNLMARRNLLGAADAVERWGEEAAALDVTDEEVATWRRCAAATFVPYDSKLKVHQQARGFTEHAVWDFEATEPEQYPLLLHFPYFDLYRKQVVKQADLVLALFAAGDRFTAEEKARDFAYYEPLTVRDSSLSASIQAIIAAETGHLELAYDYLGETAMMDLHDLEHNTRDGLHIASLAGSWMALVCGFGGFRDLDGLTFAPRLPPALKQLSFRLTIRGCCLCVTVEGDRATYEIVHGEGDLEIAHHGEALTIGAGSPQTHTIPPGPRRERLSQPPGREPRRRGGRAGGGPNRP
jgi:alpha,alpha-trehalose phosphorylase